MGKTKGLFINFIKGIIIGVGGVAPGVSGGTFAVMLGVYDKLTDAVATFYKDFYHKMIFLGSIGLGVGVGIIGFSNVMTFLFDHYETMVKFVFIGLMLGSLPAVFGEANKKGFIKKYLIPFVVTFTLTLIFAYLDSQGASRVAATSLSFQESFFYGGVIALGTIVPGISSSIILMYAGVYESVLAGISTLNLAMLIPMGIGFGITGLLLAKLIHYMFTKFYGYTYYMVLGFVMGSIVTLMPRIKSLSEVGVGLVLIIIGTGLSYGLGHISRKRRIETE